MQRIASTALLAAVLSVACTKKDVAPDASAIAGAGLVATSTAPRPTIVEMLTSEAKNRPKDTPSAEAVIDALRAAGFDVKPAKQSLAYTVKAKYCAISGTSTGLGIAICEYESAEAAEEGKKHSLEKFSTIPNREIAINKKTTLTLRNTGGTESGKAEVAKAFEVFSKL